MCGEVGGEVRRANKKMNKKSCCLTAKAANAGFTKGHFSVYTGSTPINHQEGESPSWLSDGSPGDITSAIYSHSLPPPPPPFCPSRGGTTCRLGGQA